MQYADSRPNRKCLFMNAAATVSFSYPRAGFRNWNIIGNLGGTRLVELALRFPIQLLQKSFEQSDPGTS
jgi:hypothetical protein